MGEIEIQDFDSLLSNNMAELALIQPEIAESRLEESIDEESEANDNVGRSGLRKRSSSSESSLHRIRNRKVIDSNS
jgi:hypothetical protein